MLTGGGIYREGERERAGGGIIIFMQAEISGTASALLTTTAFLPQVVKAVKTRKTDDLSYGMLLL
jgi:uncharacterized protein with PQ loop repeat